MGQFNDLFKILLSAYEEYNALLEDEARVKEGEWFDEIDNQVFFFKRKITCWLQNPEKRTSQKVHLETAEAQYQKYQKGQRHQRNQDRGSNLSKEKELEDKIRVVGLAGEA